MASIITATTTSGLTQSADNSGVLQLASGTGNLVTVPSSTGTMALTSGLGLTEADQWRVTANTNIASATTVITANWERSDNSGAGYVGTGMTQSSGVFTFPTTGNWYIRAYGQPSIDGSNRYNNISISITLDNSNWNGVSSGVAFISRTNTNYTLGYCATEFIFNVTSTTNCKVRFTQYGESAQGVWNGDTTSNTTGAIFMRLGAST
jgi:hypothetical protein